MCRADNYNFQAKDTLLTSVLFAVSSSVHSFPCGKMDSNTFTVYESHFNLQEIKEAKFIVANIILVKVATQHRSLYDRAVR